jgi:glutaredoxin
MVIIGRIFMVILIGKENCSRCEMTKKILTGKGIEFEYYLESEIPTKDRLEYKKLAFQAKILDFPIIIKDGQVVTIKEVI